MTDRAPGLAGDRSAAIAAAAEAFHEAVFDIDVLLHIVAERISRATGDFCSVALVSADERRLQPLVAFHSDPALIEDSRPFLGVSMDLDGTGPWARVVRERRSLTMSIDPDHLPAGMAPHQVTHIRRWRIREAAFIPLIARDRVVGGLNLNRLEGSPPFTADDIDLLESLGVLAARAIANARLLEAEKQASGELKQKVEERTHEAEARALEARAAVARLQAALNTPLSTVVIATDLDGKITAFNPGAEQLLGYKAVEVVGSATPALFMSAGPEPTFAALAARVSSSAAAEEFLFKSRSGTERPVELTISPIAALDNSAAGYVLVARDISERKALEADLNAALAAGREVQAPAAARRGEAGDLARSLASWERFSRQRLEGSQAMAELSSLTRVEDVTRIGLERIAALFEAIHGSIALADAQGLRAAAVLHGDQPPEELRVGAQLDQRTPIARALATAAPVLGDMESGAWSDSMLTWASAVGAGPMLALPLVSGARVVAVVTLIRGRAGSPFITSEVELATAVSAPIAAALEVSRLVAELRHSNAELSEASLHKSQFLANMSHELRTPLTAILGFSQLLIDDAPGRIDAPTRLRFLDRINSSGKHLLALINDILDLSKIEAGQMELQLADTSLAEIFDAVVSTIEPLAGQKNIKITAEPVGVLHLTADPGKVRQILLNLVSNGVKFTPNGGQVTMSAAREGPMIEVRVRDTGIGMSEDGLQQIFKEFKQLDQGPGRQQEGTGLGLALSRRFAELHGGTLGVRSAVGEGSTFILRLPAEQPAAAVAPVPVPAPPVADPSRPLVLVVEDNPEAAELLARHLDGGGFRVEIARTGAEALIKARDLQPVAVTLDILLPEIDGWEVLARLKQDPATRDIPVVIASVVDNQGLGRALGAVDYFVKPIDGQALLARLAQFRVARRQDEELRILLVDDDPVNLDYLQAVLRPTGMAVIRASGGREGIDKARAQLPHLVLLDLMMPEVTGFDVVEALRGDESTRAIPIMVLTAKQLTDEDKRQLNGYVAGVFERKSLAAAELLGWLRQLVGA